MRTHEGLRPAPTSDVGGHAAARPGGAGRLAFFGHTGRLALAALSGCALLVSCGTAVSFCWSIHPLLSAAVLAGLGWALVRTVGRLVTPCPSTGLAAGRPDR